jgi:uncharacterized protein (TIGR04551 family)
MSRVAFALASSLALALAASPAGAGGLTDHGAELYEAPASVVDFSGYLRTRGSLFHNLDLDRGPTPSGQLLFPVSVGDPTTQTLSLMDMRLRTDLGIYAPSGGMAIKARVDWLDNVAFGSQPEGIPSASSSQRADLPFIRVRRVWGELLTPLGLLSIGRMGNDWGLGIVGNGGHCADCDSSDGVDRVAFTLPLAHHLFAFAYDFSATGPFVADRTERRVIDFEPGARVHSLTFAFAKYRGPENRLRRTRAGKITPEYGSFVAYRFQNEDVPASYLPVASPQPLTTGQVMSRGYEALALDAWLRFEGPGFRIEAEGAYLHANVDQASLVPGVLYREPVTSNQIGFALESEFGDAAGFFRAGLDAGYASGDGAPGFGAYPKVGAAPPVPGDLDGAQADPPFDAQVNNFRFHPDYRVDRILFREIIGAVTDAVYVKPHLRYDLVRLAHSKLAVGLAGIVSFAVEAGSAPGGAAPLGVEIDPTIRYVHDAGFEAALEQATLFPLAGLDNPALGLAARPAQLWRLRLHFGF